MQADLRASAGATVQNLTFNFFWEGIHLAVSTSFRSAPADMIPENWSTELR